MSQFRLPTKVSPFEIFGPSQSQVGALLFCKILATILKIHLLRSGALEPVALKIILLQENTCIELGGSERKAM